MSFLTELGTSDTRFDLGKVKEVVMDKLLPPGSITLVCAESGIKAFAVFVFYQRGDLLLESSTSVGRE